MRLAAAWRRVGLLTMLGVAVAFATGYDGAEFVEDEAE